MNSGEDSDFGGFFTASIFPGGNPWRDTNATDFWGLSERSPLEGEDKSEVDVEAA